MKEYKKVSKVEIPKEITQEDIKNFVKRMEEKHIYRNKSFKKVQNVKTEYKVQGNILLIEFSWEGLENEFI